MYPIVAWRFPIYFLEANIHRDSLRTTPFSESRCMFASEPSSISISFTCFFFVYVAFMFFPFLYFTSKFWKVQSFLYSLTWCCYLLSLPSFANIFWFISFSYVVRLVCNCLFFLEFFHFVGFLCVWSSFAVLLVIAVASSFFILSSFLIQVFYFCSDSYGGCLFDLLQEKFYYSSSVTFCLDFIQSGFLMIKIQSSVYSWFSLLNLNFLCLLC